MEDESPPRAMSYVCVDMVKTMTDIDLQARRVARRLGYAYIGLCRSSSLIVPEALTEHVRAYEVELLIVPTVTHLRGRVPPELADVTDIHDLATGCTHEREGGYAPDDGHRPNPLTVR